MHNMHSFSYILLRGNYMKEEFKEFVSSHPELIKYVNRNEMTWQKFYDMYSLYGEKSEVWDDYLLKKDKKKEDSTSLTDIVDVIKKVDVDTVQKNIISINKALNVISSLINKEEDNNNYTPRPLYKKFED